MKKFLEFVGKAFAPVVVLLFAGFLVVANVRPDAPAVAGFVELPSDLQLQVTGLVVALVAFCFAKLIEYIPVLAFLEEFREPFSLALATQLLAALQNALPSAYPEISILVVQLILAVLAAVKFLDLLKKRGVRALK